MQKNIIDVVVASVQVLSAANMEWTTRNRIEILKAAADMLQALEGSYDNPDWHWHYDARANIIMELHAMAEQVRQGKA
jgi:hypothetical protein